MPPPNHGAAPPYDPNEPFSQMEATNDEYRGEIFVEERCDKNKPRVLYSYRSDGVLIRRVRDHKGISAEPGNPNLFGRFAKRKAKTKSSPPYEGGVAAASADGVVLFT
jgi:hypothetical protein